MLTTEQEKWLSHLSDADQISVVPFDPTCEVKFLQVKDIIQRVLGIGQPVEHRGASSLGISGQDEIDVYVPVAPKKFYEVVGLISNLFGKPRSNYALKRARFVTSVGGKQVEVFVINQEDEDWRSLVNFHSYLQSHSQASENYRKLKEEAAGQSTREYYRRKIEFINATLADLRSAQ